MVALMGWSDFDTYFQILANYYFGSYMVLGIALFVLVILFLNSQGFDFTTALILTLPFLAFMVLPWYLNWFKDISGSGIWILCVVLIFIAFSYANGIKKIMG
ncbi:MAG TPA: hypothetical protein VMQ58_01955 [Candidatus Saccharimonadales bacterium]|nr:hypothetical protein [Candidatus Saccharimonadales bacterium]